MRPLVPFAIAVAGGILLGQALGIGPRWAGMLFAVVTLSTAWAWRRAREARAIVTFLVGAAIGVGRIALTARPADPGSVAAYTGGPAALIVGRVSGLPQRSREGARLEIDVERVNRSASHGRLRLRVLSGLPTCLPDDRVAIIARMRTPRGYRNFGVPDGSLSARIGGLAAVAAVARASHVRVLTRAPPNPLRAIAALRARLSRRLDARASGDGRALIGALALGERALASDRTEEAFRRSGTTHLLSISGVHLAAIGLLCYAGLRRALALLPAVPTLLSVRAVAAGVTLPACVFYALLAGAQVPVVRATVMALVMLAAVIMDRARDAPNALAVAALVLLLAEPGAAFEVSFQLSFAACIGLVLAPRPGGRGLAAAIARTAAATGAASLATAGLCAYHFGQVPVLGTLTNLVAIPYSTFVLLPVALLAQAVPALIPAAEVLSEVLIELVGVGSSVPLASIRVFTPTLPEIALLGLAVLLLLRRRTRLALAVALLLALAVAARHQLSRVRHGARVTVLDVGQGEAVLVEMPGRTLLYDGGGGVDGSPAVGERVASAAWTSSCCRTRIRTTSAASRRPSESYRWGSSGPTASHAPTLPAPNFSLWPKAARSRCVDHGHW